MTIPPEAQVETVMSRSRHVKLFSHLVERPEPRQRWQKNDHKTNLPSSKAESVSSATLESDVGGDQQRRSEGGGSQATLVPEEPGGASAPSLSVPFHWGE